jgi:valyl-tRNA synthetase
MVLRLFHPFVPFITEALWEKLNEQAPDRGLESVLPGSAVLIVGQWPAGLKRFEDEAREKDFALIQQVIRLIRNLKARYAVSPTKTVDVLIKAPETAARCIAELGYLIRNLAFLGNLEVGEDIKRPVLSAVQVEGEIEVVVVGLLDPAKEKTKLEKQKEQILKNLKNLEKKLSNPGFLEKAPLPVVEQERKKLEELKSQIQIIDNNLKALI